MRKTLKLMVMLLCVAAVATLSSCSKDNEDLIIGKWEIVKFTDNLLGEDNSRIGEIWEFKTDGMLSSNGGCLKSFEASSFYVHTPLKKVEEKNAFLFGHVIKISYLCN